MATKKGPGGLGKPPTGDYTVGHRRPPESGKIKPGEVRNPHGRNGKPPAAEDPFDKAANRRIPYNIDGAPMVGPAIEAAYMLLITKALKGETAALRLMVQEQRDRRGPFAALPTAAELQATLEEDRVREDLASRLRTMLNDMAELKQSQIINHVDGRMVLHPRVTAALAAAEAAEKSSI